LSQKIPFGRKFFAFALKQIVPYTGALGSTVKIIENGRCVIELQDRRLVRNHLGSVHAMALANLAEITTGLCMLYTIGDKYIGILTGFEIKYHKKARGLLTAESLFTPNPEALKKNTAIIEATIKNSEGVAVATATAHWSVRASV
jgi:acyl-coenzyme A thioesterase PaaI-like protein